MSLFGAIQLGSNALKAQQIGLQVTGQNIANANTPGYIREEVVFRPAPGQRLGNLVIGLGVEVAAIVQKIDLFLEERLRGAVSDRADSEVREQTYLQLESVLGELSETDLSTTLNEFFASIQEILNQPESVPVRNLATLKGATLADEIRRLYGRISESRDDADDQVADLADDVNRLVAQIAELNQRIAETEGGTSSTSDAVGLRDQRNLALAELAELVEIRARQQADGTVSVFAGGDFLVFQGEFRQVHVREESIGGVSTNTILLNGTNSPLAIGGGKLAGLIGARDQILGDFLARLDQFAATLTFEFNKLFSSGQGLTGYDSLVGEFAPTSAAAPLDEAGLPFTPRNGSFDVLVYNELTGLTQTTSVRVDLNGLDDDTSLTDLAAALSAVSGLAASVTPSGQLQLRSLSPDHTFAFANDSSGVLAALGINTFFSGTGAATIGVNPLISRDPTKFAASTTGIGHGTDNAVLLGEFLDRPLGTADRASLSTLYDRLTGETTQASAVARSVAEGLRVFEDTLRGQQLGISGVSLDEEAVRLITYQRAYQAAARYIAAVSEMLELLVRL